jgi:1,4-dihydroxy-2-naphthoyl-CoA hydrolase
MPIWQSQVTLDTINERIRNTMVEHLGIELLEIGDDFLKARMPVDRRTKQTTGILHGGASVTLAETLGSIAASCCIDRQRKEIVGLEINANHIRPASEGWVIGITKPIHIGTTTQIWEIRIYTEEDKLICISRLTVANLDR